MFGSIGKGLWTTIGFLIAAGLSVVMLHGPATAQSVLETRRSCTGTLLSAPQRLAIIAWDGDSREAHGRRVYDFRVRCRDGTTRDIIALFLAAERSDRWKRDGDVLAYRVRSERKRVMTREAGCKLVPKQVRTAPPLWEAQEACRGKAMPMACQLEYMAQDRWETRQVEKCWSARYETREVPVWQRFPVGHAPLPRGARIVQEAQIALSGEGRPAGREVAGWRQATPPRDGGPSSFWLIMVMALSAGGTFYYFRQRERQRLREEVAAARAQMGAGGAGFGADLGSAGFGGDQWSDGRGSRPGGGPEGDDEQAWSYAASGNEGHDRAGASSSKTGTGDGLPETLEEACALLNVTPETPREEVNRIYTAMARVWHPDKATSDADRKRREAKMKQLNAARDLILRE